jgi:hypothetical protein
MIEKIELIDAELDAACGGVSDLGKYITKAVDDAISAAIGGNTGRSVSQPRLTVTSLQ